MTNNNSPHDIITHIGGKCQNKFSNKENHDSEQNIFGSEVSAPEFALLSLYKSHQGFSKSNSKRWFINVHPPRNYGIYEIFGTNFETKAMPAVILKSENKHAISQFIT